MSWEVVVAAGPLLETWRQIHNAVIWTAPLTAAEVAERSARNRLTLAYAEGELIGNATVRPPREPDAVATVIVRVLPEHRREGHARRTCAPSWPTPERWEPGASRPWSSRRTPRG